MSALSGLEEQIAALMPAHEAREYRAKLTAERTMRAKAQKILRDELAKSAIEIGEANLTQFPRSCVERAMTHLNRALSAAAVIDPEEVP